MTTSHNIFRPLLAFAEPKSRLTLKSRLCWTKSKLLTNVTSLAIDSMMRIPSKKLVWLTLVSISLIFWHSPNTICQGLIPVYKDLLQFYAVASEILASRSFVFALIRDQISERLPSVVEDFIEHADSLKLWISKAIVMLLEDVNKSLLEEKSKLILV